MKETYWVKKSDDQNRLEQQINHWETQITQGEFQKAALTNQAILDTLKDRSPQTRDSDDLLRRQAGACQTLLHQIITDQAKQKKLAEQLQKTRHKLNLKTQSIDSLKTSINTLNQTIQTLKTQKNSLEEQIERMKQIDLK